MNLSYFFRKYGLLALVLIAAFIILPTGTPEDLFTSIPIIATFGLKFYILLCFGFLLLLFFLFPSSVRFLPIGLIILFLLLLLLFIPSAHALSSYDAFGSFGIVLGFSPLLDPPEVSSTSFPQEGLYFPQEGLYFSDYLYTYGLEVGT